MNQNKKIRVGVVGPEDSLQKIQTITTSYVNAQWLFFAYENVSDAPELVTKHINDVDVFLFSGEIPYQTVVNSDGNIHKPLLFIPHTGTALYRTLFDMAIHHRKDVQRISIDTVSEEDVVEVYRELGVPHSQIYFHPLAKADADPSTWGEFHLQLWKDQKIDAAVTTLSSTYHFLRNHEVPVFRIRPTESIIRSYLDRSIRIGLLEDAQKGQLLIQLINIDQFGNLIQYLGSEYEAQKIQLELYKRLLDYAREIEGSFTSLGKDSFLLITTQGAYQRFTEGKLINPIPHWVLEHLPITISVGIGQGRTGMEAETHARIALKYAQEHGGGSCFFASALGQVSGPLDQDVHASMSYQIEGKMLDIAKQAGISPSTLGKVGYVVEKLGRNEITAVELAQHLKITPRQARRIVTHLEKAGVAKRIGEESPSVSGRPRTVYKIVYEK